MNWNCEFIFDLSRMPPKALLISHLLLIMHSHVFNWIIRLHSSFSLILNSLSVWSFQTESLFHSLLSGFHYSPTHNSIVIVCFLVISLAFWSPHWNSGCKYWNWVGYSLPNGLEINQTNQTSVSLICGWFDSATSAFLWFPAINPAIN